MPLTRSASKGALGKNIGREEAAGKPKRQAEAIAFSVQRKAKAGKERSTSDGHMVDAKKKC